MSRRTILVLGDQLNRATGALADVGPEDVGVRMVLSRAKLAQRPWHRAKLHLVISAMRRFADGLREEGFEVDWRVEDTWADGLDGAVDPVVMAPSSWDLRQRLDALCASHARTTLGPRAPSRSGHSDAWSWNPGARFSCTRAAYSARSGT